MCDPDIPHREETKKMAISMPDPVFNAMKAFPNRTKSYIPWQTQSVALRTDTALKIYTNNVY
jgi:hypothetical protein